MARLSQFPLSALTCARSVPAGQARRCHSVYMRHPECRSHARGGRMPAARHGPRAAAAGRHPGGHRPAAAAPGLPPAVGRASWCPRLGSQLTIVAVSYQTYRLTGSTAMVGLVSLGQLVPLLAGSLLGGPLVDAWDRRRVMLFTQLMLAAGVGRAGGQRAGRPSAALAGVRLHRRGGGVPGPRLVGPAGLAAAAGTAAGPARRAVRAVGGVPADHRWPGQRRPGC